MRWIEKLLGRTGKSGEPEHLPCVMRYTKGDVAVEVKEYLLDCGHLGYRVDVEFYAYGLDKWVRIASFRDFNLDDSILVLQKAQDVIRRFREN